MVVVGVNARRLGPTLEDCTHTRHAKGIPGLETRVLLRPREDILASGCCAVALPQRSETFAGTDVPDRGEHSFVADVPYLYPPQEYRYLIVGAENICKHRAYGFGLLISVVTRGRERSARLSYTPSWHWPG